MFAPQSLYDCLLDLEKQGQLVRVRETVDPYLEMAEIQRRAYLAGAPALLFENVKDCQFPAVSNLYGTQERCAYLFRKTWDQVQKAVAIKADPADFLRSLPRQLVKNPGSLLKLPFTGLKSLPKSIRPSRAPVMARQTDCSKIAAYGQLAR